MYRARLLPALVLTAAVAVGLASAAGASGSSSQACVGRIALGEGSYKLRYVSVVVILASGVSAPVRLPNQAVDTPARTLPYTCTGRTLRLNVPTPAGGTVTLTLRAERA